MYLKEQLNNDIDIYVLNLGFCFALWTVYFYDHSYHETKLYEKPSCTRRLYIRKGGAGGWEFVHLSQCVRMCVYVCARAHTRVYLMMVVQYGKRRRCVRTTWFVHVLQLRSDRSMFTVTNHVCNVSHSDFPAEHDIPYIIRANSNFVNTVCQLNFNGDDRNQ